MAKAKIVTKSGTKILIEGSVEEVREIISTVNNKEDFGSKNDLIAIHEKPRRSQKSHTATDLILTLRESGYFDKPRNLVEIKHSLEEQGMIYPITTIAPVLLKQVRKRNLGRIKKEKKWCYVKR